MEESLHLYEPNEHSVVIGPAKLTSKDTDAPENLEHGGTATLTESKWVGYRKKKRSKRNIRIAARPYNHEQEEESFDEVIQTLKSMIDRADEHIKELKNISSKKGNDR